MSEPPLSLCAFVLCGGLGTRLRTVLSDRPKSMALIGGVPFLEILLRQLHRQGIRKVVLGTGYLAEQIHEYFEDGTRLGMKVSYSREEGPLGTGGALKLAEGLLSDPIIVLNGDSYVDWTLKAAQDLFATRTASLVMVLQSVPDVSRYGSVTIDDTGRITEFVEKGTRTGPGLINAGVYLLEKKIVSRLPLGKAISLERDIFPQLLDGRTFGIVAEGLFIDIGVPSDLERAQAVLGREARENS
jgi:NDP-sugar pyrophosphorylase family protein